MKAKTITFFLVLICISSCNLIKDDPNEIFQQIGLNANKIPSSFERVFKEFRQQKANGTLQLPAEDGKTMRKATCVEVVNYAYANTFKKDIERIKDLNPDDDAVEIVNSGIDLFEYADQIQSKDFMIIAKMIDEGKSDEEVDKAARNLDDTKGIELDKKYTKVMNLLLPYADKKGVEYKKL
ncbi:hypothetical protein [Flavobacterium hungaricum]|uniref:Lipoprotein n=1 Tax=Flavobacterium hungaricum TaxID=2082725 RepID=A0ABR9TUK1_9FLAO|nr:hypothetical protein [Flavobacterium hungaricum]MBE8728317.1 hypothetical protein [Flavobacterium hungaricum]